MKFFQLNFVIVSLLFNFSGFSCEQIKAALDIGSGSTKMKIAKVDTCKNKILQILKVDEVAIPFKEDLIANGGNEFSQKIQDLAKMQISALVEIAKSMGAEEVKGVATAAFRQALNAPKFIQNLNEVLQTNIKIIPQEVEAKLGFFAASAYLTQDSKDIVVWDIGGASMQISFLNKKGELQIYKGDMAAVSFKDRILKFENLSGRKSPNPLGDKNVAQSLDFIENYALDTLKDQGFVLKKFKRKVVVGIGSVHVKSVQPQANLGARNYGIENLDAAILAKMDLNDEQIHTPFASTDVTNLILVKGYMQALKISQVKSLDVNLADGVLAGGLY